ncbi:cysteine protease, putative [Plasmodium knowlesi strain H]|uniref:Cysteine protease, putative n=3 Tax=Plasmodium knowlesi TaxID=5850 RepID=A0A1A7VNU0_PLAKH|nr:cysteine protease, putative [Plasmodium knowlesi strain H]OTN66590.1 putative Cysteine protease [Plasmodium knowlesi]CAA9986777.1 cysteine protease, putative [Plasmodium knowlesi strain H]SBO23611.1 cysteine protease, putative [Plasmodium knowlesi strain H]SBO25173.1 cysteine protease, putative [Plasmodium knowlesi strain H]VVS76251.1 cysteine protease, putative [Plasmodium knowlesi strain H]
MVSRFSVLLIICVTLGTYVTRCGGDGPAVTDGGEKFHTVSPSQGGSPDSGAGDLSLSVPGQASQNANSKSNAMETASEGAVSMQVADPSEEDIQVTSALLKNYNGIKITGSCKAHFRVFLAPHLWIYAAAPENKIQLRPNFGPITSIDLGNLINDCKKGANSNFKFVVHTRDNILTLKWKVTGKGESPGNEEDVKKYKLPSLERPFTSIQVHSANAKSKIIESKFYDLGSSMPAKCDLIAMNCFLKGSLDIEQCYHCTLLEKKMNEDSECFKYVSIEAKEFIKKDTPIKAQEEDANSAEHKLIESIEVILKAMYKSDKDYEKKELISLDQVDTNLKKELSNYCQLMKQVDTSGTLKNYKLANEVETYRNLKKMLQMHKEENIITLQDKLRNAAICMKDIDKWIINKRGLTLPDGVTYSEDNTKEYLSEELLKELEKEKSVFDDDVFDKDKNGVIDLNKVPSEMKFKSPYFKKSKYCNNEYCDRWKDKTSCISNIEVEEQGDCGLCWIFASKLHLETIRCMRGYGHFRSSALFVANCSNRDPGERCSVGSNPTEFLQIVKDTGFLPLESDLPYKYTDAKNSCPMNRNKWTNLWGNTKLLYHVRPNLFLKTLGYVSYESKFFRKNIDLFIDMLKREIQNKGSVIIYIKTEDNIDYDFNGKIVHSLCGHKDADHAANIVGYGNYINVNGEKSSYWLIRNSWGYYWGDEGNFKVDMYGPPGCKYNFIHTAVVFKIDLGIVEVPKKAEKPPHNYFAKYVPNFLYNLFFVCFDGGAADDDDIELGQNGKVGAAGGEENAVVDGQAVVAGQTENTLSVASKNGAQPETNGSEVNAASVGKPNIASPMGSQMNAIAPQVGSVASTTNVAPLNVTVREGQHVGGAVTLTPVDNSGEKKIPVTHILKYVKETKMTKTLVNYDSLSEIEDSHSCARTYAKDEVGQEECIQFCLKNWSSCKGHYNPGYCLTKMYTGNNCIFCSV